MKEITHELLGYFTFEEDQCVWRKKDKLIIFNQEFDVNIDIVEYDEEYEQGVEFEEDTSGHFQDEQIDALTTFYDHKDEILKEVENAIFAYYQENFEIYRSYENTESNKDKVAPVIGKKEELSSLLQDMGLFIAEREATGLRKIGITFECTWDSNHGLGILLKNEQVAAIGTIDDAIE
ncbi:hypothetical protein [Bacillus sp. REN10]|uniref:DUF6985 domain-containing protein n=1 Tax=Bacillus sp. REN10 TaxID=2782541 RepID=UPI00193C8683|nr:hypothetical protein [Bacillus sp. REN10]